MSLIVWCLENRFPYEMLIGEIEFISGNLFIDLRGQTDMESGFVIRSLWEEVALAMPYFHDK